MESPGKVRKRQRLNRAHESLLYVSPSAETVIHETKLKSKDKFVLIEYQAVDEIMLNCIGFKNNFINLSSDDKLKFRLINDFLGVEFSRDVGEGTEHLYRISEIIAKDYFDLPPKVFQGAWCCYPSIANKSKENICFRPEIANEKLVVNQGFLADGFTILNDESVQFDVKADILIKENTILNIIQRSL